MKLAALFALFCAALPAEAEIRPSFQLDVCAWDATHVVVVTEGEQIDGRVKVLETWKGDVAPGETLYIPELAAFAPLDTRLIQRSFFELQNPPGAPTQVSGRRMILFLREKPGARAWEGANSGGMRVSTVWIEGNRPYAFVQEVNPGDATLIRAEESEESLKRGFVKVSETRASLDRALKIHDAAARAEALKPIVTSDAILARREALAALAFCGSAALPVLQALLHDPGRLDLHGDVIDVMAKIGDPAVGDELTSIVREECAYWKTTAPDLHPEWWNDVEDSDATQVRRNHYRKTLAAIRGLRALKYAPRECDALPAVK